MKELLEVVMKDPTELKRLVSDHNRRIATTNEAQLVTVRALQAQQSALTLEIERFLTAIALGKGAAELLVNELEKRQRKLTEVATRIADAEALVHPLLAPRLGGAEDFRSGDARLFSGQMQEDRALLDPCVESIAVYGDGTLVLKFKEAGLFEPLRYAPLPPQRSTVNLPDDRKRYADELAAVRDDAAQTLTREQLDGLEVDVLHDPDGRPAFVMMTPGVVTRTFGHSSPPPDQGGGGGDGEKPLASPTGFEPVLAA